MIALLYGLELRDASDSPVRLTAPTVMSSDGGHHTAHYVGDDTWTVSWLPGCVLTGSEAVFAMMLASTAARHPYDASDPAWQRAQGWARQLDLTAADAAEMLAAQPV